MYIYTYMVPPALSPSGFNPTPVIEIDDGRQEVSSPEAMSTQASKQTSCLRKPTVQHVYRVRGMRPDAEFSVGGTGEGEPQSSIKSGDDTEQGGQNFGTVFYSS
ncbi:uncharacterized protein LOC116847885 [Odontomachus brunneus]|uniref:uncharacterized protein LOC116847885 n=1 Tax=Odontomachus brunneus TaxID=486640 RepID=UPI0013F1EB22|nr:uncharacterized protein LOC116847885 [Odontomachus brunneus]